MGWRLPQPFILRQCNRRVAKGLVREMLCDLGKVPRHKPGLAVREFEVHRRLAFDFV